MIVEGWQAVGDPEAVYRLPPESQALLLAARARLAAAHLVSSDKPSDRIRGRMLLTRPLVRPPDDPDPDQ